MSNRPSLHENLSDILDGDQWQALADQMEAFEEATMTEPERRFRKVMDQAAKGLLTKREAWCEVLEIVLASEPDTLLPAAPDVECG